ncbi:hypothetical protein DL93DRAFT_2069668 [Clavulina sp. PMI_390]|nr:hypothetical protein DL93DRAFT_2069668 [Clavulina sp. PMI_390]
MDAPTASAPAPGDDETPPTQAAPPVATDPFVPYEHPPPPKPPSQSAAAPGTGKFRVNKVKLKLPERDEPAPSSASMQHSFTITLPNTQTKPQPQSSNTLSVEEELDELMGDDLGLEPPKPAKRARTRAPKQPHPTESSTTVQPSAQSASSSSRGAPDSGEKDTMMSAWQVNMSTPAASTQPHSEIPPAAATGGGNSEVWDVSKAIPAPKPRKRAPAKPKASASNTAGAAAAGGAEAGPSAPKKRASAVKKKVEDVASVEGTPPPTKPLNERSDGQTQSVDIREIVDSGRYKLAPSRALVTKAFAVQPPMKTQHAYATAPPLDRSRNRPRHWEATTREIRTISGAILKAKVWMGDEKSELAAAMPPATAVPTLNLPNAHESSPAPSSIPGTPAKHPSIKRAQGQSKPRKNSKRAKELALAESAMSSDVSRTREPSVDTEMLSLMGDEDGAATSLLQAVETPAVGTPNSQPAKGQYKRKMADTEMDEFLADD